MKTWIIGFINKPKLFARTLALLLAFNMTGLSQAPTVMWLRGYPAPTFRELYWPRALQVDQQGDVVVVGAFRGGYDFGLGTLTSLSGLDPFDGFIKKISGRSGETLWSFRFGGDGNDEPTRVAIDSQNNIIVMGTFEKTATFGATTLTCAPSPYGGADDIFIAKISPHGQFLWAKRFGGSGSETADGLALDAANNIYVTGSYGWYGSAVDFGNGPLPLSGGSKSIEQQELYIARLSPTAGPGWSRGFGGPAVERPEGLAVGPDGNLVIIAQFEGTVSFGGTTFTVGGIDPDILVAKYNGANGAHLWSLQMGTADYPDIPEDIAIDSTGAVSIVGRTNTPSLWEAGAPSSAPSGLFVAQYSASGQKIWSRGLGGATSGIEARAVALDRNSDVIVAGMARGGVNIDGQTFGGSDPDFLIAKFAKSTGARVSAFSPPNSGNEICSGAATDAGAHIFFLGNFFFSLNTTAGLLTNASGGSGGFVGKIAL